MRDKNYYVYILASKKNGTLYVGVTLNLMKKVFEHKSKMASGFTPYQISSLNVGMPSFKGEAASLWCDGVIKNVVEIGDGVY